MRSDSLMRLKGTLAGVLFFCSFQVFAQNWQDLEWQRLLIYRVTLSGHESEADEQSFFIHKEGKTNPKKELQALIESLHHVEPDQKKNSFCRFPARIRYLKKHMTIPDNNVLCEDYEKFRNRVAAKSVSVVFSSYYMNNPASSFGHTFIRLGKQTNEERDTDTTRTELLDTGINYGALTEGAGPVLFAVGGLTGIFQGNYNAVPYYYKVREYNDYETRDLWSYQLNFTQDEIDFIVDYIWELGHTKFDYYFLTENCSYHVLSILEATRPSLALHAYLPSFYAIPSETLKAMEAEGLIRKITFRPAPSTQFYQQLKLLSPNEQRAVKKLVFNMELIQTGDAKRDALIYDTALSLVDYKYAKDILKGEEKAQLLKRPLLVARSKIPVKSEELDFSDKMPRAPHLGHGQKRFAITYMNSENKNMIDAEWRFAFHDALDNDIGFPPKTKLEVGKAIFRTDGHDHQIRDVSLIDVMMLGRWDQFEKSGSWKIKMGQWQTRFEGKDLSTQGVSGGYGYSYEVGIFTPYLLAHLESSYISELLHKYKFGYGGDLGILAEFTHAWKLQTEVQGRVYPWRESLLKNEIRYSTQHFGVGAFHQVFFIDGVQEAGLRIFRYL